MIPRASLYKIMLDGEWSLKEFYEFPHVYFQVYSVFAALEERDHNKTLSGEIGFLALIHGAGDTAP